MTRLARQVAFLTGQSDPRRCALSAAQHAFLDALPLPEPAKLRRNFPYADATAPHAPTPLWRASVNNGWQFLVSRRGGFAARHRDSILRLIDRAERTLLLAGSCGAELLNNLRLPPDALARVGVFAFGPVARALPACRLYTVRGARDWLSRAFVAHADLLVDCGHLDYLANPRVLAACRAQLDALFGDLPQRAQPACASI